VERTCRQIFYLNTGSLTHHGSGYAMTATTALTAQNTLGVQDVHHTPPSFVNKQIDACIDDIGVDVVKTGTIQIELI
jgi:hydroxymethylpyrimidine/phosphomethylpyrimidine kinase